MLILLVAEMTPNPYIVFTGEVLIYTDSDSIWSRICDGAKEFVRPGVTAGGA